MQKNLMRPASMKQVPEEKGQSPSGRRLRPPTSRPAVLLAVYLSIALAPLALAYMQDLPRRSFSDEMSSALAMVAFAMLLGEFVLSGRFKSVSGSTVLTIIL